MVYVNYGLPADYAVAYFNINTFTAGTLDVTGSLDATLH